jgi:hypothetical protein
MEFFILGVFIVQQLGIMLGVGAETVLLCAYLVGLHKQESPESHERFMHAVRMAQGLGLFFIIGSGLVATALHFVAGSFDVLLSPAFLFKWLLIWLVFIGYLAVRAPKGFSVGFIGAAWYALFIVHNLAPVANWVSLAVLFVLWTALFLAVWGLVILVMRNHPMAREPLPRKIMTPSLPKLFELPRRDEPEVVVQKPVVTQPVVAAVPPAPPKPTPPPPAPLPKPAPPPPAKPTPPPPMPKPVPVPEPPKPVTPVVAPKPISPPKPEAPKPAPAPGLPPAPKRPAFSFSKFFSDLWHSIYPSRPAVPQPILTPAPVKKTEPTAPKVVHITTPPPTPAPPPNLPVQKTDMHAMVPAVYPPELPKPVPHVSVAPPAYVPFVHAAPPPPPPVHADAPPPPPESTEGKLPALSIMPTRPEDISEGQRGKVIKFN